MLKRKYIKRMYIEIAFCDKCGAEMVSTGQCLCSYPAQYPFKCSNPKCDGQKTFWEDELPGKIRYEFEDEDNV